jgi:hypothetical protein
MRLLAFGTAAICLSLLSIGSAQAADGCGWGAHRGPFGYCRPNDFGGPGPYAYGGRPYWGWHAWGWHRPWGYGWHRW